jgi:rSAM/selenodomain-associated transferase 2
MISVIIPTLNEGKRIGQLLDQLAYAAHHQQEEIEIIIADGGSNDLTLDQIKGRAMVVVSERGRAKQMNEGARIAKGSVLWFVHADSQISIYSIEAIRRVLTRPTFAGGGFSIQFDDPSFFLKMIAFGSNWRAKSLNLFFGDQGIFLRREVFDKLGGFASVPLMEDWILSKQASKDGKLELVPEKIVTSSRRFHKHGMLRTFIKMQWIKLLFLCGVPTDSLERMYRRG